MQIAQNAGEEGSIVVQAVLANANPAWGFDAQTGQYVDMIASGIIDPTKVVRTSLADAVSVASLPFYDDSPKSRFPSLATSWRN